MSLETNILDFIEVAAGEMKAQRNRVGDLSSLSTTAKTNLVLAINELDAAIANASGIDDNSTGTSSSWSSSKTAQAILDATNSVRDQILGGAGAAYDTLAELQALLQGEDSAITAINTALGARLRVDAAQGLSSAQQATGRANLDVYGTADIGDPTTDFVAAFNAALA